MIPPSTGSYRRQSIAQAYRDYDKNLLPTEEQKRFAWYVNQKTFFNATEWEDYRE